MTMSQRSKKSRKSHQSKASKPNKERPKQTGKLSSVRDQFESAIQHLGEASINFLSIEIANKNTRLTIKHSSDHDTYKYQY